LMVAEFPPVDQHDPLVVSFVAQHRQNDVVHSGSSPNLRSDGKPPPTQRAWPMLLRMNLISVS
jgi:hypothetical protein